MLLLPLFAMQFTDDVIWYETDFIVFGAMLVAAGSTFEIAARMTANNAYRAAVGIAVAAAFLLVWMNLAVGIIGSEGNPANLMYGGVLAVAIVGAVVARFRQHGMTRALVATALAQMVVAAIALMAGEHRSPVSSVTEILGLNGLFAAVWLMSAVLSRKASAGAVP